VGREADWLSRFCRCEALLELTRVGIRVVSWYGWARPQAHNPTSAILPPEAILCEA
jgi:hypothetical protein